jgi:hypothetical protein
MLLSERKIISRVLEIFAKSEATQEQLVDDWEKLLRQKILVQDFSTETWVYFSAIALGLAIKKAGS